MEIVKRIIDFQISDNMKAVLLDRHMKGDIKDVPDHISSIGSVYKVQKGKETYFSTLEKSSNSTVLGLIAADHETYSHLVNEQFKITPVTETEHVKYLGDDLFYSEDTEREFYFRCTPNTHQRDICYYYKYINTVLLKIGEHGMDESYCPAYNCHSDNLSRLEWYKYEGDNPDIIKKVVSNIHRFYKNATQLTNGYNRITHLLCDLFKNHMIKDDEIYPVIIDKDLCVVTFPNPTKSFYAYWKTDLDIKAKYVTQNDITQQLTRMADDETRQLILPHIRRGLTFATGTICYSGDQYQDHILFYYYHSTSISNRLFQFYCLGGEIRLHGYYITESTIEKAENCVTTRILGEHITSVCNIIFTDVGRCKNPGKDFTSWVDELLSTQELPPLLPSKVESNDDQDFPSADELSRNCLPAFKEMCKRLIRENAPYRYVRLDNYIKNTDCINWLTEFCKLKGYKFNNLDIIQW